MHLSLVKKSFLWFFKCQGKELEVKTLFLRMKLQISFLNHALQNLAGSAGSLIKKGILAAYGLTLFQINYIEKKNTSRCPSTESLQLQQQLFDLWGSSWYWRQEKCHCWPVLHDFSQCIPNFKWCMQINFRRNDENQTCHLTS